ncbi:MAG: hypothetical protein Tsb0010_06050 [Parvularculaceae bacterium]
MSRSTGDDRREPNSDSGPKLAEAHFGGDAPVEDPADATMKAAAEAPAEAPTETPTETPHEEMAADGKDPDKEELAGYYNTTRERRGDAQDEREAAEGDELCAPLESIEIEIDPSSDTNADQDSGKVSLASITEDIKGLERSLYEVGRRFESSSAMALFQGYSVTLFSISLAFILYESVLGAKPEPSFTLNIQVTLGPILAFLIGLPFYAVARRRRLDFEKDVDSRARAAAGSIRAVENWAVGKRRAAREAFEASSGVGAYSALQRFLAAYRATLFYDRVYNALPQELREMGAGERDLRKESAALFKRYSETIGKPKRPILAAIFNILLNILIIVLLLALAYFVVFYTPPAQPEAVGADGGASQYAQFSIVRHPVTLSIALGLFTAPIYALGVLSSRPGGLVQLASRLLSFNRKNFQERYAFGVVSRLRAAIKRNPKELCADLLAEARAYGAQIDAMTKRS